MFLFGVIALQLFKGALFTCTDDSIATKGECVGDYETTDSLTGLPVSWMFVWCVGICLLPNLCVCVCVCVCVCAYMTRKPGNNEKEKKISGNATDICGRLCAHIMTKINIFVLLRSMKQDSGPSLFSILTIWARRSWHCSPALAPRAGRLCCKTPWTVKALTLAPKPTRGRKLAFSLWFTWLWSGLLWPMCLWVTWLSPSRTASTRNTRTARLTNRSGSASSSAWRPDLETCIFAVTRHRCSENASSLCRAARLSFSSWAPSY